MIEIGSLTIENPVFLAPMAGYTNLPFRLMAKKFGAGAVFSEMISAKGLYYKDKKTAELMLTTEDEAPAGLQLFGSEPDILAEVVKKYINPLPFALLDFNAGCPAPKIVKNGEGSALMKNPALLGKIVKTLKSVSTKPVVVKTRIGWDEDSVNILEIAEVIEEAGADAHTIHGRTRSAFYSGQADWEIIAEVKRRSQGIPIILNGDIDSGPRAKEAFETTGCDAVMVGRAAVGNPFIFKEINDYLKTGETSVQTPQERVQTALEHTELLGLMPRESAVVKEMRKHLAAYTKGLKNATQLRGEIFKVLTRSDISALLRAYMEQNYD
ncbi:MAG: tRNA dihydrouridine synthase DusB [Eubacterium sp.]|nr:tRNA dihydrouridine synthase DusB [Eubacterium sp.]